MNATATLDGPRRLRLVASNGYLCMSPEEEQDPDISDAEGADELIEFVSGLHDRLPADSRLREELAAFAARLERHRTGPE
jgi:hypothetical protein